MPDDGEAEPTTEAEEALEGDDSGDEDVAGEDRDEPPDSEGEASVDDGGSERNPFTGATNKTDAKKPKEPRRPMTSERKRSLVRGSVVFAVGFLTCFLMMANSEQVPHGPLVGFFPMLLLVVGLLDIFGLFARGDAEASPLRDTPLFRVDGEPTWQSPRVGGPLALAILFGGMLVGGYESLPIVILCALAALLPSAMRRPGLLVFAITSGMYLPMLGVYGLWDPWETHYGEVAREILSRDDWLSLWWAQENWFWSKPILIFWSEALTMGALGVDYLPDAHPAHPEWALRLPIYAMATTAILAVYHAISNIFSKRAGVLSALVLATMPHFFFLAHQSITDMPLSANVTVAMSMLVMALATDKDKLVKSYTLGPFTVSAQHLVLGVIVLLAMPQALYLITRNVTLFEGGFAWHGDQFMYGSAHNAGVPGNADLRDVSPQVEAIQPIVQGLVWLSCLLGLLFMLRKERRVQALYMATFYVFCALGFMGKGIPGFALPGMIALFYLIASRRWDVLFTGQLRIARGALTILVVGMPWYIAMYMRHGTGFTDRLLVHDHINRLAQGVHGDNGSIQYFIEQLGFATFPWVALLPAAVLAFMWQRNKEPLAKGERDHQRETLVLFGIWFFTAFTLFSAMITKFHHYIFPAVPAAAVLVGIVLDRIWGKGEEGGRPQWSTLLAVLAPLFFIIGIAGLWGDVVGYVSVDVPEAEVADWVVNNAWDAMTCRLLIVFGGFLLAGAAWLRRVEGGDAPPLEANQKKLALGAAVATVGLTMMGGVAAAIGAITCAVVVSNLGRKPEEKVASRATTALGVALAGGAVLVAFVGRDLSWVTSGRPQGYERLLHLFVYNYARVWPVEFDYRPILTGFAIAATCFFGAAAFRSLRPVAGRALVGVAIAFCAWVLNVYMVDLSRHWGQRDLIEVYYEERTGPEQPLVAWQMNWKGENFYTGNRVSVFVDLDNVKVREWIEENEGLTAFFMFEPSRMNGFRGIMRGHEIEEMTDKRVCDKFMIVRVTL